VAEVLEQRDERRHRLQPGAGGVALIRNRAAVRLGVALETGQIEHVLLLAGLAGL
jgi:hypothetical protein